MNAKSVMIGFLSGATIGTVAALLLAPQKGKCLRAEIARKASEVADDVNNHIRDAAIRATDAVRSAVKRSPKVA